MKSFAVARLPELRFGPGVLEQMPTVLQAKGCRSAILVSGGSSFRKSASYDPLLARIKAAGLAVFPVEVPCEPTVELVDGAVADLKKALAGEAGAAGVLAVGGGSVIDAGKAIAALLTMPGSILDYMEVLGTRKPAGTRLVLLAAPTTGGTGTEATRNAVIARTGPGGSKRSIRHDNFVPDAVFIDPSLALSCPSDVTAASGLDAITQLVEAYTSTGALPFTDSLALSGLDLAGRFFLRAVRDGAEDLEARGGMALAAYYSGVCLANAGLGVVHGIASPLCGMYPVSHGLCCGSLVGQALRVSVEKAAAMAAGGEPAALRKYANAGRALSGDGSGDRSGSAREDADRLVAALEAWIEKTGMPRLSRFGLDARGARNVAAAANAKTHPVPLSPDEISGIIERRL